MLLFRLFQCDFFLFTLLFFMQFAKTADQFPSEICHPIRLLNGLWNSLDQFIDFLFLFRLNRFKRPIPFIFFNCDLIFLQHTCCVFGLTSV
jgi:hypothetical protein